MLIFSLSINAILFIILIIFAFMLYKQYKNEYHDYLQRKTEYINKKISKHEKEESLIDINLEKEKLEYSKQLITYIKEYSAQIAVIKFRNFKDTHNIENSTRQQFENLIRETAKEVKGSIDFYGKTIFTDLAIDKLIIDSIIMYIKELIDKNSDMEIPFDI